MGIFFMLKNKIDLKKEVLKKEDGFEFN